MRQFYEAVAFDQKFSWSDVPLRLLSDPRAIVAGRVSMPRKAAVVPLDHWLPSSLVSAWNQTARFRAVLLRLDTLTRERGRMEGALQTHASEWFGNQSSSNVISFSSLWWSICRPQGP